MRGSIGLFDGCERVIEVEGDDERGISGIRRILFERG